MATPTLTAIDYAGWQIRDTAVLAELRAIMDITPQVAARLAALHEQARAITPQLAEAFYARLMAHGPTAEYLQQTSLDARHRTIGQWFSDLFSGVYDETYVAKRIVIGQVHVRIGLPVRYPLAMLDVVTQFGEQVAQQSPEPELAMEAFRKVLALDVAIFNQAYEDDHIKHLAELVGGEHLALRLLIGAA